MSGKLVWHLCIVAVGTVFYAPPSLACGEWDGWLTEQEVRAHQNGEPVFLRFVTWLTDVRLAAPVLLDSWERPMSYDYSYDELNGAVETVAVGILADEQSDTSKLFDIPPPEAEQFVPTADMVHVALRCDGVLERLPAHL